MPWANPEDLINHLTARQWLMESLPLTIYSIPVEGVTIAMSPPPPPAYSLVFCCSNCHADWHGEGCRIHFTSASDTFASFLPSEAHRGTNPGQESKDSCLSGTLSGLARVCSPIIVNNWVFCNCGLKEKYKNCVIEHCWWGTISRISLAVLWLMVLFIQIIWSFSFWSAGFNWFLYGCY